jgi:CHAT domain-containing protein/Tfp pilus assembly protein PilF
MFNKTALARVSAKVLVTLLCSTLVTSYAQPAYSKPISNEEVLEKVFEFTERQGTTGNVETVQKLRHDAQTYVEKKDLDKALAKLQEAYGLCKDMKFEDGEGQVLTDMAVIYQQRGQIPRAKMLGENAVEVLAESTDKKNIGRARVLLAEVYLSLDNPDWAIQQLDLAMKNLENLSTVDGADASKLMLTSAALASRLGQGQEELKFLKGAAAYSGLAGDADKEVQLLGVLAKRCQTRGLLTAASEEARNSLQAARNSKRPDLIQSSLILLGNTQFDLCEFASARKSFEEALRTKVPNAPPITAANSYIGYAYSLAATGDSDQAKSYLEKALPVLKKDKDSAQQSAETLNALGIIDSLKGKHTTALQYLREALAAQGVAGKNPRPGILITINLASAEARAGENRTAKSHYISALNACNTKDVKDYYLQSHILCALEEVAINLKEFNQAAEYARQGIAQAQSINDDSALWRHYTNLVRIQNALGIPSKESLVSAVSFFRSPQAGKFPAPEKLSYPSTREELGFQLVSQLVSAGMVDAALLTAEQLKEESFINEWHRRGGEVKPSDREIYVDLVNQRAHLHAAEMVSPPSKLLKEWRDWLARFTALARENRQLAALIAPVPISLTEVIKIAQTTNCTVVDYLVGPQQSLVFTVDGTGRLMASRLNVGRDKLQAQVAAVLTGSGKSDEPARETERRLLSVLYAELMPEPVQRALPHNADNTVVIVPDAVLFNLPFAALMNQNGKYFIESHTLTLASSLGNMMSVPRYSQDASVVMAGTADGAQGREADEATAISGIFEPTQIIRLEGKEAQLSAIQEQARNNNSMLHIAPAFKIHESNPLCSVLPFSAADPNQNVEANKLFGLSLPSDLAVMSGTSVNSKDFQGNGVKVFSRGLGYAGVRNVLISLWVNQTPDRTTELVDFYRGTQSGLNQAQSLRKAQLLAISKDPSPRTWAAFQLVGPGH